MSLLEVEDGEGSDEESGVIVHCFTLVIVLDGCWLAQNLPYDMED